MIHLTGYNKLNLFWIMLDVPSAELALFVRFDVEKYTTILHMDIHVGASYC